MIVKKTEMIELPLCCCDCRERCTLPVECHYMSDNKTIKHVKTGKCPLVQFLSREEAITIISAHFRYEDESHVIPLANELGFKEDK